MGHQTVLLWSREDDWRSVTSPYPWASFFLPQSILSLFSTHRTGSCYYHPPKKLRGMALDNSIISLASFQKLPFSKIQKYLFPNSIPVCSFPGSLTAVQDWAITTTKKKETAAPDGRGCNNNHRDLILQRHQKEKCFQNKMYCQQTTERFWPLCRTIKSCVNANISHSHSASQGCQMPNVSLIVMIMKFGECKLDLH